jgi:thiamine-monophosphate kinase
MPAMPARPALTVAEIGERAVIERIRALVPAPPAWVTVGIGDDAAVLEPARNRSEVITTDALVEGVHFDRAIVPPAAIGHKALAVNLSDLAAMGAEPRAALLSLILPAALTVADLDQILAGWTALAAQFKVTLVGGNVTRSPGPLVVDATVTGSVRPRRVLTRAGARPGDGIYVTGTIGAALAGRLALARGASPAGDDGLAECMARFVTPVPRVRLGLLLGRNRVASSCVDLSDGLADAVRQVSAAGRVGAEIDADAIPVPDAARRWLADAGGDDPLTAAVAGGEDYELLFTVSPRRRRALAAVMRLAAGVPCTRIGTVTADRSLVLARRGVRTALPEGFAHFR